jgi:hypothetical protein
MQPHVKSAAPMLAAGEPQTEPVETQPAPPIQPVLPLHNPHSAQVDIEHEAVGCFPRAAGDTDNLTQFMDRKCVTASNATAGEPCRSGLPFYRLRLMEGQTYLDCFSFCLSKGLDLSGIIALPGQPEHQECRCGASPDNAAAWLGNPHGLGSDKQLPAEVLAPDAAHCALHVWRYTGTMVKSGVPFPLLHLSVADEAYMDSVVVGHDINSEEDGLEEEEEEPADAQNKLALAQRQRQRQRRSANCQDDPNAGGIQLSNGQPATCSQLTGYCSQNSDTAKFVQGACPATCGLCSGGGGGYRSCYPNKCAGGTPWQTKENDGKVYVNYYFCSNIDAGRKSAILDAVQEWQSKTCIRFRESSARPTIKICVDNQNSCSATVGYPGGNGEAKLNPGWCQNSQHVGSIVHELGHIMGINHEQRRPDAGQSYQTPDGQKGPYIRVYWQNIPNGYVNEYKPSDDTYIGSSSKGYAQYDYESIMHYAQNSPAHFDTVNPTYNSVVGQRDGFSSGDVAQIEDMYQCSSGGGGSWPAPSPAAPAPQPAPQPAPSPAPSGGGAGCTDAGAPAGWKCGGKQCTCSQITSYCNNADHKATVQAGCAKTCGVCSAPAPAPVPAPAPSPSPWGNWWR